MQYNSFNLTDRTFGDYLHPPIYIYIYRERELYSGSYQVTSSIAEV